MENIYEGKDVYEISPSAEKETVSPESETGVIEKYPAADVGYIDEGGATTKTPAKGLLGVIFSYARRFHIEEHGIERVAEDDRSKQSFFDGFTMWASANFTYVV